MSGPVRIDQIKENSICALVYAGPGVGKTIFACGSQYMRTFVFDIDQGLESVISKKTDEMLNKHGFPSICRDLIMAWKITTYNEFVQALDWFVANQNYFDLGVVDSASELQKIIAEEVRIKNKHITCDQKDWGIVLNNSEFITRRLRFLNKHILFTAHEDTFFDENQGIRSYTPSFQGRYARDHAKHFSYLWRYCMVPQVLLDDKQQPYTVFQRYLDCTRDLYNTAKDRSSALEKYEWPHIDHIFKKIIDSRI